MTNVSVDETARPCDEGQATRHCIIGEVGTGKTTRLVEHVAELLESGAEAGSVLVLTATPTAARAFALRLGRLRGATVTPVNTPSCWGFDVAGVTVTTPRAVELFLLGCGEARSFTGRQPHILAPFETNVLVEDLKTSGLRPGRLREMLKFFYRGWTELADDDPTWLVSDEERDVYGLLAQCLGQTGSMLEPEVANLALRFARTGNPEFTKLRRDHVVVDDYQSLSRASQLFACSLALRDVWIAANPEASADVFESYPYAAGVNDFCAGAEVERLEPDGSPNTARTVSLRLAQAAARKLELADQLANNSASDSDGLAAHNGTDPDATFVARLESFDSPESEWAGVADIVQTAVEGGLRPCEVFVVAPNRVWSAHLDRAMDERGIKTERHVDARCLNVDVRDNARTALVRAFTLLRLADDADDTIAWRSWCAFGDWLANSVGFAALRRAGVPMVQALEQLPARDDADELLASIVPVSLAADEKASLVSIAKAYRSGVQLVAELDGLRGRTLVDRALELAGATPCYAAAEPLYQLLGLDVEGSAFDEASAGELLAHAYEQLEQPALTLREKCVCLGSLDDVRGLRPKLLVVSGFVNGFVPRHVYFDEVETSPEKRARMFALEATRLMGSAGAAHDVVFTSFTSIDVVRAERLGIKADRIRMRDGKRVALTSTSVLAQVLLAHEA